MQNSNPIELLIIFALIILSGALAFAQENESEDAISLLKKQNETLRHRLDVVEEMIDDQLWVTKVGDEAYVDKVYM